VAALYGHDLTDPRVAADFLVLRGVHQNRERALAELDVVRATPVPSKGARTPLRSWYAAVVSILILAGFLSAPDENEQRPLTRWEKVVRAIRFIVAALIWALTWVVPITFMILMAWGCENDARRFGHRVATHYADNGEDAGAAIASADRRAAGNRAVSFTRGALVVVSVAIPLALIASTLVGGSGPLGVTVPEEIAALLALALVIGVALLPSVVEIRPPESARRAGTRQGARWRRVGSARAEAGSANASAALGLLGQTQSPM
jgi:hypothetical protein